MRRMIQLIVATTSRPSGHILATALENAGARVGTHGNHVVSYGVTLPERSTTLNARAGGSNKLNELRLLETAGIPVPHPLTLQQALELPPTEYPLLARKATHMGGKDIRPVFQIEELQWRTAAGAAYFVKYIPWKAEYRVWVFRTAHLGTYEKIMVRPDEYRYI